MSVKRPVVLLLTLGVLASLLFSLAGCSGHRSYSLGGIGHTKLISKKQRNIQINIDLKRVKNGVSFAESIENIGDKTVTVSYDQPLSEINIESSDNKISKTIPQKSSNGVGQSIKLRPHQTYGQNIVLLPKGKYYVTAMFYLRINGRHFNIPLDFDLKLK